MPNTARIMERDIDPFSVLDANYNCSQNYDIWNRTRINSTVIPPPGYTDSTIAVIIVYCVLFVIAAGGNLSVVITLFRSRRHRRSRVSLMICHLAVADLMVAFIVIPLEVGWRITIEWQAGNIACKVFLFLRAFCLYLSSNVLVCVSLDRCSAVVYPLRVSEARRRGKVMLACAWIIALINAVPQSIIFRVQQHPNVPGFQQCVTFGFFSTSGMELAYNLFCVIAMYFLPLIVISAAYTIIICEIANRSKEKEDNDSGSKNSASGGTLRLRCNDLTHIERARQRTLRLTITIVCVFFWCWTPYVVMTLWYMIDRETAEQVDGAVQDGLFLMAVSNSCMNPLVYGSYAMKCRKPCRKPTKNGIGNIPTVLPRKSSDGGPHSDRLTVRDHKIEDQIMTKNIRTITLIAVKTGSVKRTATGSKLEIFDENKLTKVMETQAPYPSFDELAVIDQSLFLPRPSFCSDPTSNLHEVKERNPALTRSLDTGGWR